MLIHRSSVYAQGLTSSHRHIDRIQLLDIPCCRFRVHGGELQHNHGLTLFVVQLQAMITKYACNDLKGPENLRNEKRFSLGQHNCVVDFDVEQTSRSQKQ